MTLTDWVRVVGLAVTFILIALLVSVGSAEYDKCRNRGGEPVRSGFGYACVQGVK